MTRNFFRFKKTLLLLFVFFFSKLIYAQQVSFVYLQTENQQPFYVRVGEKIFSSTSSGSVLLSNLIDSTYTIKIGLQGNKPNEKAYELKIHNKDFGLLLKINEGNIWSLVNLQTNEILEPILGKETITIKSEKRIVSAFTEMLALAADDSTLKESQVIALEEVLKEQAIVIEKSTIGIIPEKQQVEIVQRPNITFINNEKEEPYQKSSVVLFAESNTTEGFGLIFFDEYSNGQIDTVNILIESSKINLLNNLEKKGIKNDEKLFVEIIPTPEVKIVSEKKDSINVSKIDNKTKRDSCIHFATMEDFMLLRKLMASELTDSSMLQVGQQIMKLKCYTVNQVKNLGALFLTDESKFNFYKNAFLYLVDPENFALLQMELKEGKYIDLLKTIY